LEKEAWIKALWDIDNQTPNNLLNDHTSVKEEESAAMLGTARKTIHCLGRTYERIRIAIAVLSMNIDGRKSLVTHIEWAHGILVFSLDRVVELHH
jgi:hypothetical protein